MENAQEIVDKLSSKITKLKEAYSVNRIGLFGSFAHGAAGENSDVDILVELAEPSFDHYMDLKFYLEEIFGRPVDLVLADTIKPRLKSVIKQEVIYAKGL